MTFPRRQTTSIHSSRDRPREADVVVMPLPLQPPVPEREPQIQIERIGDILRQTRERRGDDLHHIAEYLCIRRGYLEAIEKSEYEKFPADAYVIGFLRSYAELLGLDGKECIDLYRAEMAGRRKKTTLTMPTPMPEGRSPSVFVLIGAVITAILVYAMWYGLSTSDRTVLTPPPPLPSLSSSPLSPSSVSETAGSAAAVPIVPVIPPISPSAQAGQPAPGESSPLKAAVAEPASVTSAHAASEAVKPPHLVIRAEQSSWVMISDSKGQTVFDRVLKPEETYKVPDGPGLYLTTGNGAGLILTLDGVDLPKISSGATAGSSGILRNIPLDSAHLKAATQRD
jgi:cytoskeleton protein RodZ